MSAITDRIMVLKQNAPLLAASSIESRNNTLKAVSEALVTNKDRIFEANQKDISFAEANNVAAPVLKRLKFDESKLKGVLDGIDSLINLPDPLERILLNRDLDEGLNLVRVSCPIGVIGVIFEARPDALIQIATLCLKSGNCCILKGGSETANTNKVLFDLINEVALKSLAPIGAVLAQASERSEIKELLELEDYIDLLIPRGSNSFVRYIMDNTRIPVMGHADGVCHLYLDKAADFNMAIDIATDAKTQYVSVCNAVETILIHKALTASLLPNLLNSLSAKNVKLRGNRELIDSLAEIGYDTDKIEEMGNDDYHTEYLDYVVSLKLVDDIEDAIRHINHFGSHHTDCIITEATEARDTFMRLVDSANVYHNCSTRFADGFRYGFGAEVGISTSKLHARGPVGLEGLVTYKYRLFGSGQTVADYVEGKKKFRFTDK